jgi:hypothetical protein
MISEDIHILTHDDLNAIKEDAHADGWKACLKWQAHWAEKRARFKRDAERDSATVEPTDIEQWLSTMNR